MSFCLVTLPSSLIGGIVNLKTGLFLEGLVNKYLSFLLQSYLLAHFLLGLLFYFYEGVVVLLESLPVFLEFLVVTHQFFAGLLELFVEGLFGFGEGLVLVVQFIRFQVDVMLAFLQRGLVRTVNMACEIHQLL